MTAITYSYEIINVDEAARCMEIVYTSEGRQTMHIGARLPYEGETLEQVVEMFSPIAYWREQERPILPVQSGETGQKTDAPFVPPPPTLAEKRAVAKLSKAQFIIRCMRSGILTREESLAAAKGTMPASFMQAIVAAGGDADEAQIVWDSVAEVWRMDSYIQILASLPSIGEATADALFGIT